MVEILSLETPGGKLIDAVAYSDYAALQARLSELEAVTLERAAEVKGVDIETHIRVAKERDEALAALKRCNEKVIRMRLPS